MSGVAKKQDGYVARMDYGCVHPGEGIPQQKPVGSSDCVLAREGEVDYNAGRVMLRWDNGGPIEVNIIGDYTHDDRNTAATVLTYANFPTTGDPSTPAGLLVKQNNIDPYAPDPYAGLSGVPEASLPAGGTPVPYDSRFICGPYCNYATYTSLPDSLTTANPVTGDYSSIPLPANRADGRTKYEGWGVSGKID